MRTTELRREPLHEGRRPARFCWLLCAGLLLWIGATLMRGGDAWAQETPAGRCGPAAAGAPCDGSGPASQGAAPPTDQGVGNPIHLMTGNKYQRDSDLPALPGVLGVEIVRHYNSAFSQIHHPVRAAGRGWRFSYETELYRVGATMQIVQADGSRLIFARPPARAGTTPGADSARAQRPQNERRRTAPGRSTPDEATVIGVCSTPDPAQGSLEIRATAQGEAYVWRWPAGRRLDFDPQLRLVRIEEPTGERLHIDYDARSRISRVIDPMQRILQFAYHGDSLLVSTIDSPLGRFTYEYGGAQGETLVAVSRDGEEGARVLRRYHHEDTRFPAFLTAIDDEVLAGPGSLQRRRIARFAYDRQARAVLSESHPEDDPAPGQPEALRDLPRHDGQTDAGRPPAAPQSTIARRPERLQVEFTRPALPSGVEGLTRVINALGEATLYRFAIIAGHYRLLAADGPGCQRCGPGNVRYRYDRSGRLLETTWLGQDRRPVVGERRSLDGEGRLLRIERIDYSGGLEVRAVWLTRHEYADGAPGAPRVFSIIRPSVLPGREARTRVGVNERGQISLIEESGWSPDIDPGRAQPLVREQRLRYADIGGHSRLVEIDGPLANGPEGTPADSDVQRFDYDRRGRLSEVWLPGDRRRRLVHDEAGLLVETLEIDGDRRERVRIERRGSAQVRRILRAAWRESEAGQVLPGSLLEQVLEPEYDVFERQVALRVDGRRERQIMFDTASRPVRVTHADGGEMQIEYGPENRIAAIARLPVGAPGQRMVIGYRAGIVHDGMTLASMADESGLLHTFEADGSGRRLARRADALGQTTTWETRSSATGGVVIRSSPEPVALRYDLAGELVDVSAQGPDAHPLMQVGLDDFGRRVNFHSPAHGWVRQVWDGADRLVGVVDERLSARRIDRDLRGRPLRIFGTDPGEIVQFAYHGPDLISRRLERRRPAAVADSLIATGATVSGGRASPAGLTVLEEARYYRHDTFGRLIEERRDTEAIDQPGRFWSVTISLGYEGNSRRVSMRRLVDARGRAHVFEHSFHEDGSLAAVRFNGRVIVDQLRIGSLSGLLTLRHGNGLVETYSHTRRNRLASIQVADPRGGGDRGAPLARLDFSYDPIDRLQHSVEQGPWGRRDRAFRYDTEGRPVEEGAAATGPQVRAASSLTPVAWMPAGSSGAPGAAAAPGGAGTAGGGSAATVPVEARVFAQRDIDAGAASSVLSPPRPAGGPVAVLARAGPWHAQALSRLRVDGAGRPLIASLAAGGRAGLLRRTDGSVLARHAFGLDGERIARQVGAELRYAIHLPGPHGPRLEAEVDRHGAIVAHYVHVHALPVARIIVPGDGDSGAEFAPQGILERIHGFARRVLPADWRLPLPGALRVHAIHCDQRRAPYMVTDEDRRPIWLGRSDVSGWTQVELRTNQAFRMDLRLAGQFFDEESGTHAQHRRDYDPRTGRFLSPDPLSTQAGLSLATVLRQAGTDPTLYAGGDPLTRSDPSGLYEEDVHYYVTYFLALVAGLPPPQARLMALANRYVDDNPSTEPYGSMLANFDARNRFHFTAFGHDPPRLPGESDAEYAARRYRNPQNPGLDALHALAMGHSDPCARAFLYGEYGHAFMDTFAHRDQSNAPYNGTFGHLGGGHSPDMTYNHTDVMYWTDLSGATHPIEVEWRVNADRTLAMEEAFFQRLQADFGVQARDRNGNPVRWEDIRDVMIRFNAQEMDETRSSEKANLLRAELERLGISELIPDYNCRDARSSRLNLAPSAGGFSTPPLGSPAGVQGSDTCR